MSLEGREIVLGVTGGIAAYKAAALASLLVQRGAGVTAVLTRSSLRFVGTATFAALTGRPVATRTFDPARFPLGAHIELAALADLVVVAPATASFVIVAPAMNAAMWEKPAVQRNVARVIADGMRVVEPGSGWLSCRRQGTGRMAEPDQIAAAIEAVLATMPPQPAS